MWTTPVNVHVIVGMFGTGLIVSSPNRSAIISCPNPAIMVWRISLTISLCAVGLLGQSSNRTAAHLSSDALVARFAKVSLFAFGGIGFAGVTSDGERYYNEVMSRPNRQDLLEKVFETGTPAAKCYALVGIHSQNGARFRVLAATLHSSESHVLTAHGCIMGPQRLSSVVHSIEAGAYDRKPMADTLR